MDQLLPPTLLRRGCAEAFINYNGRCSAWRGSIYCCSVDWRLILSQVVLTLSEAAWRHNKENVLCIGSGRLYRCSTKNPFCPALTKRCLWISSRRWSFPTSVYHVQDFRHFVRSFGLIFTTLFWTKWSISSSILSVFPSTPHWILFSKVLARENETPAAHFAAPRFTLIGSTDGCLALLLRLVGNYNLHSTILCLTPPPKREARCLSRSEKKGHRRWMWRSSRELSLSMQKCAICKIS